MSSLTDKQKDKRWRTRFRRRMREELLGEDEIETIIEQRLAERQAERLSKRYGTLKYDPDNDEGFYPDDSNFRPNPGDPLLRGSARVDGVTAKVVKRRHTITGWEYDRFYSKDNG